MSKIQDVVQYPCLIDLHLHLDGSLSVDSIKKLAALQNIELNMTDEEIKTELSVSEDCRDLNEYLTKFKFPNIFLQTEIGVENAVYNLLEELKVTQPTLSHHMKVLSDCGLVSSRKDGKWQHYSISCERFAEYKEYIGAITCYKDKENSKSSCCCNE